MQEYATTKSGPLAGIGIDSYAYLPIFDHISRTGSGYERMKKLLGENRPSSESDARAHALYSLASDVLSSPTAPSAVYLTNRSQHPLPVDLSWSPDSPVGFVRGKFLTIGALLSQPVSHGTVHVRSADPIDSPVIDPRYLSSPVDVEVMAEHLLQIETIAASEPLSSAFLLQPLQRRDPASDFRGDLGKAKRYARTSSISMVSTDFTCCPRSLIFCSWNVTLSREMSPGDVLRVTTSTSTSRHIPLGGFLSFQCT